MLRKNQVRAADGSVAVGGDVNNSTVTIGFTQQEYEDGLREREATIKKTLQELYESQLDRAHERTHAAVERRKELELELDDVQANLNNLENAYQEALKRIAEANSVIDSLRGKVPDIQLENARAATQQNPHTAFEAFRAIADEGGASIAMASFEAAELAKVAFQYGEALRLYRKAVALDEKNASFPQRQRYYGQSLGLLCRG